MRTFSYGGGVQSTAALVLAARNEIDFPVFLFANVGDDSEHPKTLTYVHQVAKSYAQGHGIVLLELRKTFHGFAESLLAQIYRRDRSLPIPVRMSNGAPGRRSCTADFKIDVVAKWQRRERASAKNQAITGLGISADEAHRARTESGIRWQALDYPLLELGLTRADCEDVIRSAGLPVPPKSACWFCPFHRKAEWIRMRDEEPELLWKAIELERMLNDRRRRLGRDPVWLHRSRRPLDEAVGLVPPTGEFVDDTGEELEFCESGYCMV